MKIKMQKSKCKILVSLRDDFKFLVFYEVSRH
ncbi:MAG: hypothetical protein UY75_C0042G0004 [Parcubacteria group bacterium GW2011_GWC2_52_8c]|nr:MAG: hypothetical protein UY75_C0042G0004 [Parcubacteria group bacterium GW2011_GWC2_52_8c]